MTRGQSIIEKPVLTNRFVEALGYAAELHLYQRRKGKGQPYVGHLLGVAAIVIQHGGGEDEVIAALLHDAVEDQGGLPRLDEIREKFGDRVARIVDGCTDSYEVSSEKREWGERKRAYIEKVAHEPEDVRLVSAADKLANAREILSDYRAEGPVPTLSGCCAPGTQNVSRKLAETLRGSPNAVPENKLAKLITLSRSARFAT